MSVGKAWLKFSVIPSISENRFLERGPGRICTDIVHWRNIIFIQRVLNSVVYVAVVELHFVPEDSFARFILSFISLICLDQKICLKCFNFIK